MQVHLGYGNILHEKLDNQNLESKIEKVQYKPSIAIIGVIQGISREILCDELGLKSLEMWVGISN